MWWAFLGMELGLGTVLTQEMSSPQRRIAIPPSALQSTNSLWALRQEGRIREGEQGGHVTRVDIISSDLCQGADRVMHNHILRLETRLR